MAVGDAHRLEETSGSPPPRAELVRVGGELLGWGQRLARPQSPPETPYVQTGLTLKNCGLAGQRPGAAASAGHPEQETVRKPAPGRGESKAQTDRPGPQSSRPASPSHGEFDHGESGARAAQLRLEIRVASDRLHSHHSQRARRGGRDATGFQTDGEDPGTGGSWFQEAEAWPGELAAAASSPRALSAESRQGARRPRGRGREAGGDRRGAGKRAVPRSHRAAAPPALASLDVISASSVLAPPTDAETGPVVLSSTEESHAGCGGAGAEE